MAWLPFQKATLFKNAMASLAMTVEGFVTEVTDFMWESLTYIIKQLCKHTYIIKQLCKHVNLNSVPKYNWSYSDGLLVHLLFNLP